MQAVMNESVLATLILNMLIRMCDFYPSRDADGAIVRPLPRVKRLLSEATCLPHIVQVRHEPCTTKTFYYFSRILFQLLLTS